MTGWIKLYRQLIDHELWTAEPFTRGQAWVDLMMLANHAQATFYIRGNEVILGAGQLGRSMLSLAKRWRWSEEKVSRFIDALEKRQQIRVQKNRLTTVISITNWQKYQSEPGTDSATDSATEPATEPGTEPGTDREQTANRTGNRTGTDKNDKKNKKNKNEEKNKNTPIEFPPALDCDEFRSAWSDWLADRQERRFKPYSTRGQAGQLKRLESIGVERAVAAIRHSIANGFQGI
jgi:hypothetical protein